MGPAPIAPIAPTAAPTVAGDVHAPFRAGPPREAGPPIALVHGNCQAESLRAMLPGEALRTVRLPPVHELAAEDLPTLGRWLRRADVVVAQPIRPGYRGLPIGTADVISAAGPGTRLVVVPVVRFAGLHPEQAIVRPPDDPGAVPPVVAYHSLRTLAEAAGRRLAALTPAAARAIADRSRAELSRRERAHGTIEVSDLFAAPRFELMRTINHPGDPIIRALAERVCDALDLGAEPTDPGRPLLDAVHAPRDPAVIAAFGLDAGPTPDWTVDGRTIPVEAVREAHLRWYAERPATVAAGLRRHGETLRLIGLS